MPNGMYGGVRGGRNFSLLDYLTGVKEKRGQSCHTVTVFAKRKKMTYNIIV